MTTAAELAAQLNKAFKKEVVKLGSDVDPVARWSSGVLPVDVCLDGGFPQGRFTEWYGDYSTLKSYVAYCALGAVQAAGGTVALVDSERAYEKQWGEELGVDNGELVYMTPETGEDAIAVMEILLRGGIDFIVWDSIAATQPRQYAEKKPGEDLQPGGQARMMSAGLRRLTSANKHTAVLAINQTRVNVGMTYGGSSDSVPGGKAMSYYASYRLRSVKAGRVTEDVDIWKGGDKGMASAKQTVKQQVKITMEKSKLSAPNREVWLDFDLRTGKVDEVAWLVGWGVEHGHVQITSKSWYSMDDLKVNGRDNFIEAMREQEEVLEWMRAEVTKDFLLASPGPQQ